jgi:RNA polymerase sigma factor for flagellar operon FliA
MPRLIAKASAKQSNGSSAGSLVTDYLPLVKKIAKNVKQWAPAHADLDDLVGAGAVGLLDAAAKFDPRKRIPFHAYAKHRIRGAIQDSLRALDPTSRHLRKQYRAGEEAIANLTRTLERTPTDEEIATHLKLPLKCWRGLAQQLYSAGFSVNGHGFVNKPVVLVENLQARTGNPENATARQERRRILNEAVRSLPRRYQQVISLYHDCDWTLKKIGKELGVNESRVSQIHASAIARIRRHLVERGYTLHSLFP